MKLSREEARKLNLPTPTQRGKNTKRTAPHGPTAAEHLFAAACAAHGLPVPVAEYAFAERLGRKWRFDWLFDGWLAVEICGGVWTRGHHSRGQSQIDDMEKRNTAQILGYCVLEFTPQQIEDGSAFAVVREALASSEERP